MFPCFSPTSTGGLWANNAPPKAEAAQSAITIITVFLVISFSLRWMVSEPSSGTRSYSIAFGRQQSRNWRMEGAARLRGGVRTARFRDEGINKKRGARISPQAPLQFTSNYSCTSGITSFSAGAPIGRVYTSWRAKFEEEVGGSLHGRQSHRVSELPAAALASYNPLAQGGHQCVRDSINC